MMPDFTEHDKAAHEDLAIMITDLLRGGWDCIHHDIWRSPSGQLFRGPHYAWHIWAGTPMETPK